jgi:hypothetical protein
MKEDEFPALERDARLDSLIAANEKLRADAERSKAEARKFTEEAQQLAAQAKPFTVWSGKVKAVVISVSVVAGPALMYTYDRLFLGPKRDAVEIRKNAESIKREAEQIKNETDEKELKLLQEEAAIADKERERSEVEAVQARNERDAARQTALDEEQKDKQAVLDANRKVEEANTAIHSAQEAQIAAAKEKQNAEAQLAATKVALDGVNADLEQVKMAGTKLKSELATEKLLAKQDPKASPTIVSRAELLVAEGTHGIESNLATAIVRAQITAGFLPSSADNFAYKFKNAKAAIEASKDPLTQQNFELKGTPMGLIDLTLLGGAQKSIVFTDEYVYSYVDEHSAYRRMAMSDFATAIATKDGSYQATVTSKSGIELGPIVFAGSDVSVAQFIIFVREYSSIATK